MNYIIDFDSTLVTIEGLEELAKLRLGNISEIQTITNAGMEGKISFNESLARRLKLINPKQTDLERITDLIIKSISPSALKNIQWFKNNRDNIYIISGGFEEWVMPVIEKLNIKAENVMANKFIFNDQGDFVGVENRLLTKKDGKVLAVKNLNLQGKTVVIGDGYTDYQIKQAGLADEFIAFTETVRREAVVAKADRIINSFAELEKLSQTKDVRLR